MEYLVQEKGTLLEYLQQQFPDSSNRTLRLWLKTGRVNVDGHELYRADAPVFPGQKMKIGHKVIVAKGRLSLLYRDEHVVVVNKPQGVLSVATDFKTVGTMHDLLKKECYPKRVFPVHRLDRETSGVMIFALSETAQESLKEQFEKRLIEKIYYALVEHTPSPSQGVWHSYMQENATFSVSSISNRALGKEAITGYEVIKEFPGTALLRLTPKTGRKHQIRVHCSEAGHPIVGDMRYGCSGGGKKERLHLHAHSIRFQHPVTLKKMEFSVPLSWRLPFNYSVEAKNL